LLCMLSKYADLVLYPVPPATTAHLRKALYPSGSKDDPRDANLLLDVLVHHRRQLRCWQPDTPETRELQFAVEDRRKLVDEKTRCLNQFTARLKLYFPHILVWFPSLDSVLVWELLTKWPTLELLQKAPRARLTAFLKNKRGISDANVAALVDRMRSAIPATTDRAVVNSSVRMVQALIQQLQVLENAIAEYEKPIKRLAAEHPDFAIYDSFPGAGDALIPRLIAALGTDRQRFSSAAEILNYSGIAPVMERSGKQCWIHRRWACPKFLRQTFHEWARTSRIKCQWAREFYQSQRARGKGHHAALRSLAYKWIRILFRCWRDRVPYDDVRYSAVLARRRAPTPPAAPVEIQWKTVAGFAKPAPFSA